MSGDPKEAREQAVRMSRGSECWEGEQNVQSQERSLVSTSKDLLGGQCGQRWRKRDRMLGDEVRKRKADSC